MRSFSRRVTRSISIASSAAFEPTSATGMDAAAAFDDAFDGLVELFVEVVCGREGLAKLAFLPAVVFCGRLAVALSRFKITPMINTNKSRVRLIVFCFL
jgi:hypothetical protein